MGVISYNPQHVMRQLGYDQLTIQITGDMDSSDILTVESQFVGEGKEHIVMKSHSNYRPDKARIGVRSLGGSIYWRNFVEDQREELEITEVGPV